MARSFNGSTQYLEANTAPVTAYAFSFAAWWLPTSTASTSSLVWVGDKDDNDRYSQVYATTEAVANSRSNGTTDTYSGAVAGVSTSAWNHVGATFASSTSRIAFLNGVNGTTGTTSKTADTFDRVSVGRMGRSSPAFYANGAIAEVGIWDTALSLDDMEQLAAGYCPLFVKPANLVFYAPLHGRGGAAGNEEDWVGGLTLTATGSPGVVDHPRIIYPRRRTSIWVPPVSSGAPSITALSAISITATSAQPRISYS